MYGSVSGFRDNRRRFYASFDEEKESSFSCSWDSESEVDYRVRHSGVMNPHVVPPSQHTLFMRGFDPNTEMNKIRDFFTKEGGKCSFDFFKVSQDGTRLFVALRFESKDVARDVLNRFDNSSVLGSKITITWFKDLRRARLKAMQHGQRWTNYYGNMKNGYNRGYGHKFGGGGKLKSTIWRHQNKGGDHSYQYMQDRRGRKDRKHDDRRRSSSSSRSHSYSRSRSRSHSRTKSRSHSRSRSRSHSRSWSHSRSRERSTSPSGRRYRSQSSSSSRGSNRWARPKKRAWKGDPPFTAPEPGGTAPADAGAPSEPVKQEPPQEGDPANKGEEMNWESLPALETEDGTVKNADAELLEIAQMQCASPANDKPVNDSESRSRSSSASDRSHSKERKKKKKKHHRSKHRRHRHHRRHHHHPSSDEEGQVSEFEEGERSPTPETHRRYRKRDRRSSSSSPESPMHPDKRRNKPPQNPNLSLSHLTDGLSQHEELSLPPETPLESDGHSVKSLRSIDAPSQISDGMSPLHVSEGDDEVIAAQDKREESSNVENALPTNEDQVDSLSFLSSHLLNEGQKEDNIGTPFSYPSLNAITQNEIEQMESVVASNLAEPSAESNNQTGQTGPADQAKLALRTKVGVATKSLLEKYKFSMKSSLSSKEACAPKHISPHQAEPSGSSKRKGKAKDSLSKDKIQLIRRKRAEIEKAYRRDCQTFATVVKMLIRKDQTLDEKIQDSFRENLFDIGQQCIRDLQEFVEAILTSDD